MSNESKARTLAEETTSVSRRDFLKICSAIAGTLGLGAGMESAVAAVLSSGARPPFLWLHFAECTGCTESFLRTVSPSVADVLFKAVSLDYHETLMAGAGAPAHELLYKKAGDYRGQFFAVVEGAIPTADDGVYGKVADKTMLQIARDILPAAKAIVCLGTCSAYGGLAAAAPNPTGAKGVHEALPDLAVPTVNVPGCPPNPINFLAVITSYLLVGTLPSLDAQGRPLFAYDNSVHSICPYQNKPTYCLRSKGCKGRWTYSNCPTVKFNQGTSFPMQAGHPCIGCCEPGFWDTMTPFYVRR
jgi:[NiFe] hydrogenase small subunit